MKTRYQLLQILADGRFHSGQRLGEALGVSRSAVWKSLRSLDGLGLTLDAVSGKGYRLRQPLELFDESLIRGRLSASNTRRLQCLEVHQELDSTNSHLMQERNSAIAGQGHAVLAERQTQGRGRRGRVWQSPFGRNIYLSLAWVYESTPQALPALSLATAVVLVRTLDRLGFRGIGLKWPNDLLCDGRKLAGILLEMSGEAGGPSRVVNGIGLNLNMSAQEAAAIDQPWTDLAAIGGGIAVSRNRLTGDLLDNLITMMHDYPQTGLEPYVDDWNRLDAFRGRKVVLDQGSRQHAGVCRGIDHQGALLLESGGSVRAWVAGEVSLKGLE